MRKIVVVFAVVVAGVLLVGQANQIGPQALNEQAKQVYDKCEAAQRMAVWHAQQDVVRATKANFSLHLAKVSSRNKKAAVLPNGNVVFPTGHALTTAREVGKNATQLAQNRLQSAQASPFVPELAGNFAQGDFGMLKGQATVVKVIDGNQMVIRGRLGSPVRGAERLDKVELPDGWPEATSAEELLDMGHVPAAERSVFLVGKPTAGLNTNDKVKLDVTEVTVSGNQPFEGPDGIQSLLVLRITDLKGLVRQGWQLRMTERRVASDRSRSTNDKDGKNGKDDKADDKGSDKRGAGSSSEVPQRAYEPSNSSGKGGSGPESSRREEKSTERVLDRAPFSPFGKGK